MAELRGRVVVVTGATSGIGRVGFTAAIVHDLRPEPRRPPGGG